MTIYHRKWLENGRLELRVDRKTIGVFYLRRSTDGGWYVRDHTSIPLPWHKFT